jgi:L-aspartate oxidase
VTTGDGLVRSSEGPVLPVRLPAPPPGWKASADVVVVGSGIAGLTVALELAQRGNTVRLVTKARLSSGSTRWAQGGIAAALDPGDSPEEHLADTLVAGAGLCDREAVRLLVTEGPEGVRELVGRGAKLDRNADGGLSLTREGGHHRDRIVHAGGDATGAEVSRALVAALLAAPNVTVTEHALMIDLLTDESGITGLTLHVMGEGQRDGVGAVSCRAVVLACGGLGQIYASTTNPPESTADGMAAALRAGAVLRDLEFVQFHPTVLWLGPASRGQQPLVSEAVRGEGAFLVDVYGSRVMDGVHPMGDLAPRDVVASAIVARMFATGSDHVFLDARHFGEELWQTRFPTILAACREHGIDPVRDLIPVAPACHYASGGVATDHDGRTSIPGLYACGEVACTGVHGANRLASNSLLEGLVFGRRIAAALADGDPARIGGWPAIGADAFRPVDADTPGWLLDPSLVLGLRQTMSAGAGVLRSGASLRGTADDMVLLQRRSALDPPSADTDSWEASNLFAVACALARAAELRLESRGSHRRSDYPEPDDAHWAGHIDSVLDPVGGLHTTFRPTGIALPYSTLARGESPAVEGVPG